MSPQAEYGQHLRADRGCAERSGHATIVGENTAGAMLSATVFQVSGKYHLFLPIADDHDAELQRLDQVGVKPEIEVKDDDALDHVLALPR